MSYEDRESTWNSGVRKAIRRGSAEAEVCKHRDRVTGAWQQISKQRRRVDVSFDPSMVRRLGMAVAGNTPTASFLIKIGKMQSAECRLCRIAPKARGESTDGLAAEIPGHISSAGCKRIATTVTAAHHSIWRNLYDSVHAAQKPKSKPKFVALDKESNMSMLWR